MKRPLALIGIILALASFAGCAVALNWMWRIQKPLHEKSTRAFDRADEVLDMAAKTIDNVRGNLEQSRSQIQMVRTSASQNDQGGFFERTMSRRLAREVAPNVNDVQHSLEKVTEASIVINSILGSLHDLEGIDNLDNNQVRDLQDKMDSVTRASMDLGDLLDDPLHRSKGENAVQRAERIAATLEMVIRLADDFQSGVKALRKKVQYYRGETSWWIERGPIYVTIGLVWVMISQFIVLAVAIPALRPKRVEQVT